MNGILKLDWLAFTFHAESYQLEDLGCSELELFRKFFPELEFLFIESECINHFPFYDHTIRYNDSLAISYCDEYISNGHRLGVNVSVPSHSLAEFFSVFGFDDYSAPDNVSKMFSILKERQCKPSRIDLCFDDFDKVFNAAYYCRKYVNGLLISRYRVARPWLRNGDHGSTFYLGSRPCGKIMRIYDKYYESKGAVDSVRYEFEFHSEKAYPIFDYIIEEGLFDFYKYLKTWFYIVQDVDQYSKKYDAPIDEEWDAQLSANTGFNAQMSVYVQPKKEADASRSVTHYIEDICAGNIAGYVSLFGMESLLNLIQNSQDKIPERYKAFKHDKERGFLVS